MASLRVLSWNLRTFGSHETIPSDDLATMADIIVGSQADIICIQELMIGNGIASKIGMPISDTSKAVVQRLCTKLHELDTNAGWQAEVSGVNAGKAPKRKSQRDAYAFFYKASPAKSKRAHAEPPDAIVMVGDPVILRKPGEDNFPGRRPGMLTVNVKAGTDTVLVNLVSYHARTPCDQFSKTNGSGYGINQLATLAEVGGGLWYGTGRQWLYKESKYPLPEVDTLVLGDFNYSMDIKQAPDTYKSLLRNYQTNISTPEFVQYTTYSPKGSEPLRLVSAYDNIFSLCKHGKFMPSLTWKTCGVIDFILERAKTLGPAMCFSPPDPDAAEQWYEVHRTMYKRQHAVTGISDHLPVWAEFTIKGAGSGKGSDQVLPTSGANNNCLFHAIHGVLQGGIYVDANAPAKRNAMTTELQGYKTEEEMPNTPGIRAAILSSMINQFSGQPTESLMLNRLLANDTDPFKTKGFKALYARYVAGIAGGRMLYVHEAELYALMNDFTVVLRYPVGGAYQSMTFNPGQATTYNIFHQALHYSRWQAA